MTTLLLALLATTTVFEDPFKDKLADGWTWVREDPQGWKIDANGLHIRPQSGTLWKTANNAKNVLLRARPDGLSEFIIEVTATAAPESAGEQCGLIVYLDDDTYVKLVFESLEGKRWIVFGKEVKGEGRMVNRIPADALKSAHLRLAVSQGKAVGSLIDGTGATEVGATEFAVDPAMKVGVVSHGAATDADRWATFTGFTLIKP